MKSELKKILFSFVIVNFLLFYFNTSEFQSSLWAGFKTTLFGYFYNFQSLLVGLLFLVGGYLIFSIIVLLVKLFHKIRKIQKDDIKSAIIFTLISTTFFLIYDQIFLFSIKDISWGIKVFSPVTKNEVEIDSTNYYLYD